MSSVSQPSDRTRSFAPQGAARAAQAGYGWIEQVAGMARLFTRTVRALFSGPYTWRNEFIEQSHALMKRALPVALLSSAVFAFGIALQLGGLLNVLGSNARLGGLAGAGTLREFGPWITGMVVAGVGGTAVCADIGARKVRDEIDAMSVMALDPVRELVVPRFLALGLFTAMTNLAVCAFGVLGGWLAAVGVFGASSGGFFLSFSTILTNVELLASVLKTSIFGFIIAIVCCYKGMHVSGGSEGVGRAVNQAVVIAFAAIWIFHFLFTSTMLAAFPEVLTPR